MTSAAYSDDFGRVRPQKMRPLKALRAFRRLIADKEDTAQVFEIMRALSGRSVARGYGRMLRTVEGGRQAFLRDELAHKLDDAAWLDQFGPGTVGEAYRRFRNARGFTADGLADAEREVIPFVDAPHPVVWYSRRLRDVHDIWHVLTGYQTDALGEACVVAFSLPQTRSAGFGLIAAGVAVQFMRARTGYPCARAVLRAWRDGRRAAWLPGENYEALLAEPLDAARRRLGIPLPTIYQRVPPEVRNAYRGGQG